MFIKRNDGSAELKSMMDELYRKYNRREYVASDPLLFLYRYSDVRDREIAGLLASSLAFGNVKQIISSVGTILDIMEDSPAEYLLSKGKDEIEDKLGVFKHRWIDAREIGALLSAAGSMLKKYGSLERCFESKIRDNHTNILPALKGFVREIDGGCLRKGFLPCPERGSACKRLNLFLRWMIRSDSVDPGGWKCVPASMLIVPLDTHMFRLSRKLGLTGRSQKNMKTALEITESFSRLCPDDPVKYDFALTRVGIVSDREARLFEESLEEEESKPIVK